MRMFLEVYSTTWWRDDLELSYVTNYNDISRKLLQTNLIRLGLSPNFKNEYKKKNSDASGNTMQNKLPKIKLELHDHHKQLRNNIFFILNLRSNHVKKGYPKITRKIKTFIQTFWQKEWNQYYRNKKIYEIKKK